MTRVRDSIFQVGGLSRGFAARILSWAPAEPGLIGANDGGRTKCGR
jgi:hypothetical protein